MRNPTGILIQMHSGFVIVDAGEDFLGQLYRKYGIANTQDILCKPRMI
jgi:hypothetical protein